MTRIAFAGNFDPSHSTENDWLESFTMLGCDVTTIQEDSLASLTDLSERVKAADPALFLYVRTWGLPGDVDEAEALFHAMEAAGVVTAGVHLDRWRGLDRAHEVAEQAMFRVQHLFTADGDFAEEFPVLPGGGAHYWLPPGVRASECCESDPYPPWQEQWDVAFVGSRGYHPEHTHRPEMIDHLREWYGERFVHIGPDGDTLVDDSRNELRTIRGHWMNRAQRSTAVTVGDSCLVTREGKYWSDRVTETWSRGGFLIHPAVDALAELLGGDYPGMTWQMGDWDELRRLVDYWLAHPVEREAERLRIAAITRAEMTYVQRAETILATVGLV